MRRQSSSANIDFAVPGGPISKTCERESKATSAPSITSLRSTNACSSSSRTRARISSGVMTADERSADAIDVRGELEVSLGQPPGGMGPQRERNLAIMDEDVGMVVF